MAANVLLIGKGMVEPCDPYRRVWVYGAELGTVRWPETTACLWNILDQFTVLDLSRLAPRHEVAMGLVHVHDAPPGSYSGRWRLYYVTDGVLIWEARWPAAFIDWSPWQCFCEWAYLSAEVGENGDYSLEFTLTGPYSFTATAPFRVIGLPVVVSPGGIPEAGLAGVIEAFRRVGEFCYSIYQETLGWVWPFFLLSTPFYNLSTLFFIGVVKLTEFQVWVVALANRVTQVLSWDAIKLLILDSFPSLPGIIEWFASWSDSVLSAIDTWWHDVQDTVTGWIAAATEGLSELLAAWDEFRTGVLPHIVVWDTLTSWWHDRLGDVTGLVDSAFAVRDNLWNGWSDFRDQVATFFANPLDFLWGKFADWFLGPEGR